VVKQKPSIPKGTLTLSAQDSPRVRRSKDSSQKGLKGSLTALGTAAVLGIYSAGYALTENAARELDQPLGALSKPPFLPEIEVQVVMGAPSADSVGPDAPLPEVAASVESLREEVAPAVTAATTPTPEATTPTPARSPTLPPDLPASAPVPTSPATTVAAGTASASPEAAVAAEAAAAEAPAESPYRDGTYTSRGIRTRHGTIEATVEISGGKIVSATVTSCGMRWPCSDINRIIPRVVERQSTAIGIVSGATQSSDAFITAIDAALTQAMNPTP